MKRLAMLVGVAAVLSGAQPLWAQKAGQFGAGVIAGSPTGPTIKVWLNDQVAMDAAFGWGPEETIFYGNVLVHGLIGRPGGGKLSVYGGAGPRIEDERHSFWGLRAVGGLAYWIPQAPVELFAELGPAIEFGRWHYDNELELDGGIGARFYFGGK